MAYEPWKTTFGVGARVKVIRQRKYSGENLLGLIGTVRTDSGTNVSVIFSNVKNGRSVYGCYYFKPVDLVEVDEFDNEVVKEKSMNMITNYLNAAEVRLTNKGGLYLIANYDPDLKVDDYCVVTDDDVFRVAVVHKILEQNNIECTREVVAKINTEDYNNRVENRTKAAELKSQMEARAKKLQDIALYKMLAETDPDMAELLTRYQNLPCV